MPSTRSLGDSPRSQAWLRWLFPRLERLGLHLTANHYYQPIPDTRRLSDEVFSRRSPLRGVDIRDAEQVGLLEDFGRFRDEWAAFPLEPDPGDPARFYVRNEWFGTVDAEILHAMIRSRRPARLIEIGSGFSTLVAAAAIRLNEQETPGYRCHLTSVEPQPREFLHGLHGLNELMETPVEDLPLAFFATLGPGDILFIDSSHVAKIGSDVLYEILEIVPALAPGVLVHFHDVYFPTEYPPTLVRDWHYFWNEQYLLQAFLAFNEAFAIRWAGSWMTHEHTKMLQAAIPSFAAGGNWPSSLWIERVERA